MTSVLVSLRDVRPIPQWVGSNRAVTGKSAHHHQPVTVDLTPAALCGADNNPFWLLMGHGGRGIGSL